MVPETTATTRTEPLEVSKPPVSSATPDKSRSSNDGVGTNFMQWVDYLPGQLPQHNDNDTHHPRKVVVSKPQALHGTTKRTNSLDRSSDLTETDSLSQQLAKNHAKGAADNDNNDSDVDMMDVEDWPDSGSLEGQPMMPHYLLVEHDPVLQHELALGAHRVQHSNNNNNNNEDLATACSISIATSFHTSPGGALNGDDPSIAPELFANSLEELMEQRRRHLAAMMQASMQTRACLEPHIRQRAGFSNVLSQIDRSSWAIREHLLENCHDETNNNNSNNSDATRTSNAAHDEEALPSPPPVEMDTTRTTTHNNNATASNKNPTTATHPTTSSSSGSSLLGDDSAADTCNSVDMTGISATLHGQTEDGSVEDFAAAVLNDPEDCLL
mmetsp:Transcript_8149/g.20330  ORF Transcript_8149/g.20330 Transcript_8149/m.20330 type:complete len:384 (-) Transcript_8149:337-1488(-)|eukprot:CAMPEP_0168722106 /NCGR_PEP_ID=MMETSP0724-20121128/2427_1 /TAXON_ID=265536 /ORGANISM="Amphiprora sp., Strain CCMP467" /LENGTH=383 /DNA_ID=CAMNT_0008768769 /DNA_START=406 /DNA_END=1557 /DNA_ORIENTATION=+